MERTPTISKLFEVVDKELNQAGLDTGNLKNRELIFSIIKESYRFGTNLLQSEGVKELAEMIDYVEKGKDVFQR